jgi:hypothetical protein
MQAIKQRSALLTDIETDIGNSDSATTQSLNLTAAAKQLCWLNERFLRLMEEGALPCPVGQGAIEWPVNFLPAIAAAPYPLFCLQLHDARRWQPLLRNEFESGDRAPRDIAAPLRSFASCALFFTWHLAQDESTAKVLMNIHPLVSANMRSLPIVTLHAQAERAVEWLQARWLRHRYFWPQLLDHARNRDHAGVRTTLLLGRQLQAREQLATR